MDFIQLTLFRDAYEFYKSCGSCQRIGNFFQRNEMFQTYMIVYEIFDIWRMDSMGPFPSSIGFIYIY